MALPISTHLNSGVRDYNLIQPVASSTELVSDGDALKEICEFVNDLGVTSLSSQIGSRDVLVSLDFFIDKIIPILRRSRLQYMDMFSGTTWNSHGIPLRLRLSRSCGSTHTSLGTPWVTIVMPAVLLPS